MKSRLNMQMENTVRKGILLARKNSVRSATGMMQNRGVLMSVLVRVLFQQDSIRNTDLTSLVH